MKFSIYAALSMGAVFVNSLAIPANSFALGRRQNAKLDGLSDPDKPSFDRSSPAIDQEMTSEENLATRFSEINTREDVREDTSTWKNAVVDDKRDAILEKRPSGSSCSIGHKSDSLLVKRPSGGSPEDVCHKIGKREIHRREIHDGVDAADATGGDVNPEENSSTEHESSGMLSGRSKSKNSDGVGHVKGKSSRDLFPKPEEYELLDSGLLLTRSKSSKSPGVGHLKGKSARFLVDNDSSGTLSGRSKSSKSPGVGHLKGKPTRDIDPDENESSGVLSGRSKSKNSPGVGHLKGKPTRDVNPEENESSGVLSGRSKSKNAPGVGHLKGKSSRDLFEALATRGKSKNSPGVGHAKGN